MLSSEFLKVAILNEVRQNLKIVLIFIFMAKDAGAFNGYQTLIFFCFECSIVFQNSFLLGCLFP